ncbi:MAG: response regulator receiver domain [Lewinella sp.]|uniref:response regulator receiver domain n=1 Tax=Lewinella sp. TaxID=2004506 RepID=UPI003D6B1969
MTYNEVATEIVKDAIQSVVYIDDELTPPFEDPNPDEKIQDLSKDLYRAFVSKNISIDFYKFQVGNNWENSQSFLFESRDLVILDWQLENDGKELSTLSILKQAVNTDSLHFVCIYSALEGREQIDVLIDIAGFFSQYSTAHTDDINNILEEQIGDVFTKEFIDNHSGIFKEFIMYPDKRRTIKKTLLAILNEYFEESNKVIKDTISETFNLPNTDGYLELLAYHVNGIFLGEPIDDSDVRIFSEQKFLYLNHTIVLLTNKVEQSPPDLYTYFTNAFTHASGNFLSLMSLEINNRFKRSSALMNKNIDGIDERAFFYHKNQLKPEASFFEFLIGLWKSEVTDVIYHQKPILKLFAPEVLQDYIANNELQQRIDEYAQDQNSDLELSKLNYYYNKLSERDENDFLRFGDVFFEVIEGEISPAKFYLCITAHCDCLYPEKLNHLFYFVSGEGMKLKSGIREGDTGFNSFVKIEDNHCCVRWSDKPFTIHMADNCVLKDNFLACIAGEARELKYLCSIKENYTQRIANRAFSFPMRVGIYFADKKLPS